MIIALSAICATTAFAQNPDALKQIKKAKAFAEAQQLVAANEASMTAAEKAQAYNKLVDIAYDKASKGVATMQTNRAMEQMGQKANEAVDTKALYNDIYLCLQNALVCDKFDYQPNDKGKVAPKFHNSNAARLAPFRDHLITAGQEAQGADDTATAAKFYGMYAETGVSDLFKEVIAAAAKNNPEGIGDPYLSEVARVAAVCAFQTKDIEKAMSYTDVVMLDPAKAKEGLQLQMYFIQQNIETKQDSLRCLEQLKTLYQKYPADTDAFAQLAQWYSNLGQKDNQVALINERIANYPNDFTAWAMKGQNDMNERKYDDAIANFKKSVDCPVEDEKQKSLVLTYIGFCYNAKAAETEKYEDQIEILKQSIPFLEKAREIDPQRERSNWAYPLFQCYYNVYGENDAKTKEVEAIQNN